MTADETPERAADELAAVSQEPGCGDEQREIDWMRTPELGPIVYRGNPDALEEIRAAVRHAYVPSPVPDVCAECGWHRDDPSQHPQPAREIPADELAVAERYVQGLALHSPALRLVLDVRGRERDAARAEVEETRRLIDEAYRQRAHMQQLAITRLAEVERLRASWEAIRDLNVDLQAELERLHTWAGLMSLLDEHYPADVVTGESGDPGPRIVALTREVERLRGELERAQAEAIRLRPIKRRARDIHRDGTDHGRAVARVILGEAP